MQAQIIQQIRNGNFDLTTIAANLNTSARTIQRKLLNEKASFRKILFRTRLEMVYALIDVYPPKAISKQLGFSRPCAFYKFFKHTTRRNFTQWSKDIAQMKAK